MDTAGDALDLLGAGRAFKPKVREASEIRRLVEKGIPSDSVDILMENVPKPQRANWRTLLSDSSKGTRLSPETSDRAARLAYLLALANEVWGGKAQAHAFLVKPHPLLDGKSPLDAAKTEWGGRAVESLLRKIQFGLPV